MAPISTVVTNGADKNGSPHLQTSPTQDQKEIDQALRTFRCLIADLCEQFKGGHPG
jgi:dihydroxyacetone synthase